MDGGDVGELMGVAFVGVAVLVGKKYGPKAETDLVKAILLFCAGAIVMLLVIGLIWSVIAG